MRNDDARDIEAIHQAIEAGITHIDTAEQYAAGHAEELVGEAIRNFPRESLFITSKVMSRHLSYDEVIAAARRSLTRLGIGHLDLYLIHGPNRTVPLAETMRAMDYLLENEMTRFIGVSNFDKPLLEEAQYHTKYKIVSNQIHYNLQARAYEENGTLDYCKSHNVLVTAWRPLAKGEFAQSQNPLLQELANKYGKTTTQVALNWVTSQPNVVTLVKTSNPLHLEEDLGALGWQMTEADMRNLSMNFPRKETLYVGLSPN